MQKLRDAITQWHTNGTDKPVSLGTVKAWAVPSGSEQIHRIVIYHPKKGWACSCQGYYFGNECKAHIGRIKRRVEKRGRK